MATCDINALKAAAVANRFDRLSSQKAGALELQFWYAASGSTKTIAQLLVDACASGFTCVIGRAALAAKLQLLCNASGGISPAPCTNLIPDGAVYTDVYTLNLIVGASYTITFGVNETGLFNGAQEILNPHTSTPVTFIASGGGIFLIPSTNFSTVTAIVCGPPCVNSIPAGMMYSSEGHYYVLALVSGTNYSITFGINDILLVNQPDGTPTQVNGPGTFQFTPGAASVEAITLVGTANNLVTAIICAV